MLPSTSSWFTPFYIPTHLILLFIVWTHVTWLFTTHPHTSVLFSRTVPKMHFITHVISVSKKKKKLLAFNYRRVCQNSFHHPHNTAYFPCPSSLSTSTPISCFLLHHSTCIHWILWTAPGRNNSLPSPFIVALFVSSRHLPVHSNCTVLGSALLQTLGGTSVALTQHTGWGFFFHSKHPE